MSAIVLGTLTASIESRRRTTHLFLVRSSSPRHIVHCPRNSVLAGPLLAQASDRNPDLWLYRDRTVALLRRYLRLSIEVGRMTSVLGREFFRARVTFYKASTFEDSVIFVHDVERSLDKLQEFDRQLIAKVVLQEYSKEEAGRFLGCGYRTVERLYPEALDSMSEILLDRHILTRLPQLRKVDSDVSRG
jgi:hypothetical protein